MKIQLYDANSIQPEKIDDEPIEVGVIYEGQHFTGFWEHGWWIDLGGITVGHRLVDYSDVEYWYYLNKYEED